MNRRRLLAAGAANALLAGTAGAAGTTMAPKRPPNFIVVLCDDLGMGDVSLYGPDGIATPNVERLGAQHSWNSSRRMNNRSLFNMGRHSDHHRRPTRAYQQLEAMPDARELPSGYAGAILLALAPPLWRRVMDPRLDLGASPHAALKP